MQKFLNHKSFYIKKWSLDILVDILGGILIALGTYNFAALAQFPMAGLNGIALISVSYTHLTLPTTSRV